MQRCLQLNNIIALGQAMREEKKEGEERRRIRRCGRIKMKEGNDGKWNL